MDDVQAQLDALSEEETETTVTETEVAPAPLLTDDAIRNDKRKTDLVEVNFANQTARVVGTSDAPKLTLDVIKDISEPVQDAELIFDSSKWTVKVNMGIPFSLTAKRVKLLEEYDNLSEPETLVNLDRALKNLYLSEMIDTPKFSYEGKGSGKPIEECSDLLIEALWQAYAEKNAPLVDEIYQVTVLRGQPIHAALLLQETFELYPLGQGKKVSDMTDAEIQDREQRNLSQRQILVSSMVFPEGVSFSYNGESSGEGISYPIEDVSELFLETLHQAYRVVNIPQAGLEAVSRFQRFQQNTSGKESVS